MMTTEERLQNLEQATGDLIETVKNLAISISRLADSVRMLRTKVYGDNVDAATER